MNDEHRSTLPTLDRRGLFRLGAAGAAAGAVAGAASPASAAADLPDSGVFDLSTPSEMYVREAMLHESHHAMQGVTFDTVNRRLFIVQIRNGSDGDDLCINHVSSAGTVLGSMHLSNAGHGVSIAAEPVGTATYLWVECDSDEHSDDGRGTALLRFRWSSGSTPSGTKFFTGSSGITAAVDPVNQNLMVRRTESGAKHLTVYSLADLRAGGSTVLARVRQPSTPETFQGYTFLGRYAYLLEGDGHTDPSESLFNSYVSIVDLADGSLVDRKLTAAGRTLPYREPEGMAIHTSAATGGTPMLMMGFASRHGADRRASLYYKPL